MTKKPAFRHTIWSLSASACLCLLQAQVHACEVVPLLEPAVGAWISPQQAVLRWPSTPAGPYRLQVRISRPEGPTQQTIDLALNDTHWRLEKPPVTDKASVQVRVTVGCSGDGMNELVAQAPAFFIQQPAACRVNAASLRQQGAGLSWAAVPGARSYRVRLVHAPRVGLPAIEDSTAWLPPQLKATYQANVIEPQITLPTASLSAEESSKAENAAPLVAMVQAQCGPQNGPPAALVLNPAPL